MKRFLDFFNKEHLWDSEEQGFLRLLQRLVRYCVFAAEHYLNCNLSGHAAALAYTSVLGAVPILAIIFAIARGFGFGALVESKVQGSAMLSPEMTQTVLSFVNNYLEYATGGIFVGVGLILLFYTLYNLTSNIEVAFNRIWEVTTSRNFARRVINYVSVFFFLPVLLIVTSGLQLFLSGISRFLPEFELISEGYKLLLNLLPYLLSALAFIVLYKMMPNTKVRWRSCIVPGIIAGAAFQALQWFYINAQVWMSSYNTIYGSFAAIPWFMIFVQLSWTFILFGGDLSFVIQNEKQLLAQKRSPSLPDTSNQSVAEKALQQIRDILATAEEKIKKN
ncbi:MAG: YihY/virulence factor BrkB family protein [Bacteroidales bacterium]|nr:YihY/virulence factor BrkB family protein [Bacteroidales bacterium]